MIRLSQQAALVLSLLLVVVLVVLLVVRGNIVNKYFRQILNLQKWKLLIPEPESLIVNSRTQLPLRASHGLLHANLKERRKERRKEGTNREERKNNRRNEGDETLQ